MPYYRGIRDEVPIRTGPERRNKEPLGVKRSPNIYGTKRQRRTIVSKFFRDRYLDPP
jgi:hypothetical protein